MAIVESKAYVLHQRAYRESSALVDLLTTEGGRVTAVCKGVRGAGKRAALLRSGLQPFTLVKVEWSGKSELKSLRKTEPLAVPPQLSQRFLYAAMYINELMVRLFQAGESHDQLFFSYQASIESIILLNAASRNQQREKEAQKRSTDGSQFANLSVEGGLDQSSTVGELSDKDLDWRLQATLRQFEFQLLAELGYEVDFYRVGGAGESVDESKNYRFDHTIGFVESSIADAQPVGAKESSSMHISGQDLCALQAQNYTSRSTIKAAKIVTRAALEPHLAQHPIQSRALYQRPRDL
jgi:DNA repair protein RecO (recombination protein O)